MVGSEITKVVLVKRFSVYMEPYSFAHSVTLLQSA